MIARDDLNTIVSAYKEQYREGDFDGSEWLPSFQEGLEQLVAKSSEFENKVAALRSNA